jgi:hypothetical protein
VSPCSRHVFVLDERVKSFLASIRGFGHFFLQYLEAREHDVHADGVVSAAG